MLTLSRKKQIVADLKTILKQSKIAVLTDFTGLANSDMEALRVELRQAGVDYVVARKTLLRRAGLKTNDPGSIAVAFHSDDEIAPAKILYNFAKDHEHLRLIDGVLDGAKVPLATIQQLAQMPTRDELLAGLILRLKTTGQKMMMILQQRAQELGESS